MADNGANAASDAAAAVARLTCPRPFCTFRATSQHGFTRHFNQHMSADATLRVLRSTPANELETPRRVIVEQIRARINATLLQTEPPASIVAAINANANANAPLPANMVPDPNDDVTLTSRVCVSLHLREADFLVVFTDAPLLLAQKNKDGESTRIYRITLYGDHIVDGPLRVLGEGWHAVERLPIDPTLATDRPYVYVRTGDPTDELTVTFTAKTTPYVDANYHTYQLTDSVLKIDFVRAWGVRTRAATAMPTIVTASVPATTE